jgi:hypothetical protein
VTRLLLACLLVLLAAGPARADGSAFGLAWGVSLPTGDTGDYVSKVSFRGASVEYRHYYRPDATWGLNVGWNVFNERTDETLVLGDVAATGRIWRYVNAVPIYAQWATTFSTDRRASRFFAGLNAGTIWIERRTDMGLWRLDDKTWHPALAPEVGVHLPYDSILGFVSLRYHYAFKAGDAEAQQWLELRIGFSMD